MSCIKERKKGQKTKNLQIGSNLAWLLSFMFIVHSFQSLSHLKFILLAICRTSWFEKGQSG